MSDPSAILLPVHQALTSDMMLGLKPSAPKSRSYRISVPPLNASLFQPGQQMIFELPTGRRGTWLDQSQSFIKFSVQVQCAAGAGCAANAAGGIYIENTAYSFIQRLDVYNSSNLLETISEYGQLANFLIDTQLTQSDKAGLSSMIGSNNLSNVVSSTMAQVGAGVAVPAFTPLNTETQRPGDRSGMSLAATNAIGGSIPYTFCLPVLSGVVGVNASKMMPVGKLNAPIRCEFYLAAQQDPLVSGTAGASAANIGPNWQIINAEFDVCYVELSDDALDAPLQQGEQEYISTTTYRQSSTSIVGTTAGEITVLVPFRCASLTAVFARFRPTSGFVNGATATCGYTKSSSVNLNFASYYWRIGSSMYPNKPVYLLNTNTGNGAEGFAELLKAFHALSATIGNTTLGSQQYNVITQNAAIQGWQPMAGSGDPKLILTSHNNAFAIGLELQSFSNRSDTILSGISTLNSQVYFTASVIQGDQTGGNGNGGNGWTSTIDFFGQMDMILVLQDGILSAKF